MGNQARWLYALKTVVKSMIGGRAVDPYDLDAWVVYGDEPGTPQSQTPRRKAA